MAVSYTHLDVYKRQECKEVGPNEPLTREKLSPVLAILKAKSTDDGIAKAAAMVEFNGLGHSAAIHLEIS